jgi:hypothetical protein
MKGSVHGGFLEPRVFLLQDRCQLLEISNLLIQKEFEFFKARRESDFPEMPAAFVRFSRNFFLNFAVPDPLSRSARKSSARPAYIRAKFTRTISVLQKTTLGFQSCSGAGKRGLSAV